MKKLPIHFSSFFFIFLHFLIFNIQAQNITGSGTTGYLSKFNSASSVNNSTLFQSGNAIGLGTTTPASTALEVWDSDITTNSSFLISQSVTNAPISKKLLEIRTFTGAINNVWASRLTVDKFGRLGINSPTTTSQFEVKGYTTGIELFQVRNSAGSSKLSVSAAGNVGIGIATSTSPLDVRNSSGTKLMEINNNGNVGIGNLTPTYRLDVSCVQGGVAQPPIRLVNFMGNTAMIIPNSERVGFNVATPDVYGANMVVGPLSYTNPVSLDLITNSSSGWTNQLRFWHNNTIRHLITDDQDKDILAIHPGSGGGALNKLRVEGSQEIRNDLLVEQETKLIGKVSIGALNPSGTYTGYALGVDGDIVSKRVIVQTASWADKVFDKNYSLMTLEKVAEFINENNHLPEIPSEAEVVKNGIDLSEMNKLLLQKIEELTLYVIEQQKQIDELKKK